MSLSNEELIKALEAIFFVCAEPVSLKALSEALIINEDDLKIVIDDYAKSLLDNDRGIKIVRLEDSYQMTSNEKYFEYVEKLFQKKSFPKLSEALLETLAIICYKQPITKSEIASIRGVNSDYNINKLLELNIICEKGRSDSIGRPILLGTTNEFLKHYGINSIEEFKQDNPFNGDGFKEEAINEVSQLSVGDFI